MPIGDALPPFLRIRDLLREIAELHDRCMRELAKAADSETDLRRRVMLTFLEAREREQLRAVLRLMCGDEVMLDCYLQSVPASAFAEACGAAIPFGSCEDVAERYRLREAALEQLFGQLQDTVGPTAKVVFVDLHAMKVHNQSRLREASLDF